MPGADELPPALAPLARRNALEISADRFDSDTSRLITIVRRMLDRRQQELSGHYAQASAAADAGDREQAAAKYSMGAEADPGYRDTNTRLANPRQQQRLADLLAEARRLHRARQWAAVIEVGEQLQAIDTAAADPDGLITSARAELAAAQRAAKLVFLCHSSGDKERVRRLYRRLMADGIDCWLDDERLLPGQDWEYEINRAISKSKFVLACLSKASITKAGYVQKELKMLWTPPIGSLKVLRFSYRFGLKSVKYHSG